MKNKILSLLLSAALTLGCAVPAFAAEDGLPASDAPAEAAESGLWITAEAAQLQAFAKSVNDGESYQGQYISLNSDIDLSGIDWTPIGTSNSFKGVFDGNQYVIENLTIGSQAAAAERDAAGLFGASGLKSLVANSWSDVTILSVSDTINAVGGVVGWTSNQSAVVNCAAFGNISDSCGIDDSFSAVGGVVGYSSGAVYACYSGGDGSKADPYVISTEEHLRAFAAATVSGKLVTANRYFRLGADIALSGAWTPIHNFAGSFDGDGHTVSGMTIGTEVSPAGSAAGGFFDSLPEGASVQNLKLTGAAVCAKTGSGYNDRLYAGLLAGTVKSAKIDNCTVQGSMVSAVSGTFAYAGGLVGRTEGDTYLTNCIADVPVAASSEKSTASAGGLAGYASGSNLVANCAALGDVSVSGVSSQYNSSAAGGTAAASPKTSAKGGLITVTPESGYALGRLTAKDESGRELALTNKGSGRYTFVMPASNVTVEVSFTKSGANRFADVPSGAYYGDAVAWAVENDITAGTSETAFSPNASCTRADRDVPVPEQSGKVRSANGIRKRTAVHPPSSF